VILFRERLNEPLSWSAPEPLSTDDERVREAATLLGSRDRDRLRPAMARAKRTRTGDTVTVPRRPGHHSVYVVYLRNPNGDGRAGYYVGMTGLSPERRLENHKAGIKAARVVQRHGERLVPRLYAHLNPMTYEQAARMEVLLADSLRKRGYLVFGGH
jgi:predicted GIY-YIG superfamily endonuclease